MLEWSWSCVRVPAKLSNLEYTCCDVVLLPQPQLVRFRGICHNLWPRRGVFFNWANRLSNHNPGIPVKYNSAINTIIWNTIRMLHSVNLDDRRVSLVCLFEGLQSHSYEIELGNVSFRCLLQVLKIYSWVLLTSRK